MPWLWLFTAVLILTPARKTYQMQQDSTLARRLVWVGFLGSVSFGLVTSVVEYIGTGGVSGLTPVLATLAGGIVGLLVVYMLMKPKPPKRVGDRSFSRKSVRQLTNLKRGLTPEPGGHIGATKFHIGEWLRVRGRITQTGLTDSGEYVRLSVGFLWFRRDVLAHFEGGVTLPRLMNKITVDGEISDIVTCIGIILRKCELVGE